MPYSSSPTSGVLHLRISKERADNGSERDVPLGISTRQQLEKLQEVANFWTLIFFAYLLIAIRIWFLAIFLLLM
jgi:hypothetical protein